MPSRGTSPGELFLGILQPGKLLASAPYRASGGTTPLESLGSGAHTRLFYRQETEAREWEDFGPDLLT